MGVAQRFRLVLQAQRFRLVPQGQTFMLMLPAQKFRLVLQAQRLRLVLQPHVCVCIMSLYLQEKCLVSLALQVETQV